MSRPRPVLVGIAGGTASGKTSLARVLRTEVGREHSVLLELDSYYRDRGGFPRRELRSSAIGVKTRTGSNTLRSPPTISATFGFCSGSIRMWIIDH